MEWREKRDLFGNSENFTQLFSLGYPPSVPTVVNNSCILQISAGSKKFDKRIMQANWNRLLKTHYFHQQ